MRFYLGTAKVGWLGYADGPLFVGRRAFEDRVTLPRAVVPWVLDSGGFSELRDYGWWTIATGQYAREVERYRDEIGMLEWVAPMDWMCEPSIVAKTGLDVEQHQRRTIANLLDLRDRLGELVVPVLQGWTIDDYLRHADMYQQAGVLLTYEPVVAVGSICRRGQNSEIERIVRRLAVEGIRMHLFGVRAPVLRYVADIVASADSLSWSSRARRDANDGILPDHPHKRGGRSCANCLVYAERWRRQTLDQLATSLLYERTP